jgi:hypothetical protein
MILFRKVRTSRESDQMSFSIGNSSSIQMRFRYDIRYIYDLGGWVKKWIPCSTDRWRIVPLKPNYRYVNLDLFLDQQIYRFSRNPSKNRISQEK